MSISFRKGVKARTFAGGLFQIIDNKSLQTRALEWGTHNYFNAFQHLDTHFSVHTTKDRNSLPNMLQSPYLDVFEWIVFAPPGSMMTSQIIMHCSDNSTIEVILLYGFGNAGHLANKYVCLNESQKNHELHKTFLLTILAVVKKQRTITQGNLLMEGTIASLKMSDSNTKPKQDKSFFEYPVHKGSQNLFVLSNESYQIFTFSTHRRSYIKLQIQHQSPIQYILHLCGALGLYIVEEVRNQSFIYGPNCNQSGHDALSGSNFVYYSHGNSLKVITYYFSSHLEPSFKMRIEVMENSCQGIANICFLFSMLTPQR